MSNDDVRDGELDAMFRSWATVTLGQARPVELPDWTAASVAPRRPMVLAAVATVAVMVVVAAGGLLLRGWSGPGRSVSARASSVVASGQVTTEIARSGDTVSAIGEIVATPGQPVRFCPEQYYRFSDGRDFAQCTPSLVATGVDLTRLGSREARNGVVRGVAQLTGIYHPYRLEVTSQTAASFSAALLPAPLPDTVPCPRPVDGWHGPRPGLGPASAYKYSHPDSVAFVGLLRPPGNPSVVYVVTTQDPAAAQNALRAAYGNDICIVGSRYTASQLATARRLVTSLVGNHAYGPVGYLIQGGGNTVATNGQLAIPARAAVVTDQLARTLDNQPPGIIQLAVWLTPTH